MSSDAEHLALANRFQAAIDHNLTDVETCAEVIAIAAYYKAMHVVEALFFRDPEINHCHLHRDRLKNLGKRRKYHSLYKRLKALWNASEVARYLVFRVDSGPSQSAVFSSFRDYIPPPDLRRDLLDRYLVPLERDSASLLGDVGDGLRRYGSDG